MKVPVLVFLVLLIGRFNAQMIDIIIPGSVNNYETKANIFGSTLYLVQDGVTLSKTITSSTGEYNITGKVNKNIPFELIISKPNYISKKVYFDFKTITSNGKDFSVQAVAELVVELFAVKKGVSIVTSATDYAEKFTWDNDQKIAVPDENYKKLSDEKIINFYKDAEKNALVSIYMNKATASATAKNYQNAIAYSDSALIYKQNDNTILVNKVAYQKNLAEQVAEQKKIEDLAKLLLDGEAFIQADKLTEASAKFNEVLKKDPTNSEAKKQLDKVAALNKTQTSLLKDAKELEKLKANAAKLTVGNKFADAIVELNKALKLSISASEKAIVESNIKELKAKVKSVDVEKQIAEELKLAKKYDDTKDYQSSKLNYAKIAGLLSLLDNVNAKKQEQIINKQQDESLGKAFKTANELNSKLEYDNAIASYKLAEVLINSLLDNVQKKAKLEEVKIHISEVEQKKRDNQKIYAAALAKLDSAIDNAPATLKLGMELLSKDPLKNKASEKEVIALKMRLEAVKKYFDQKNLKLKVVWNNKDSIKANAAINEIYKQAIDAKVGVNELKSVKFSVDSLGKVLKSKQTSAPVANTSGFQLAAPGVLSSSTNASASFQQLEFTRTSQERENENYLTIIKNGVDVENYFRNMQQEVTRNEAALQVQSAVTAIEVLQDQQKNDGNVRTASMNERIQENETVINKRESLSLSMQEDAALNIQKDKNKYDDYLTAQQNKVDSIASAASNKVQVGKNERDVLNSNNASRNDLSASELAIVKKQLDSDNYIRDSISKEKQELAAKALIAQANFKESTVRNPNFIRDENGICFPWNELSERVYEVKNTAGFVVSVIVRRVVVDQYGFGVVFEHTRNERGISSFTLNGSTITEFIWFNQSSGNGVLIPNLKVITAC